MTEKFKALAVVAFGEKGNEFQAKNLRDIIYNATQLGDSISELTESFLGWKKSGAKGSYKLNEAVLRVAYYRIFKYLSIDGATKSRA